MGRHRDRSRSREHRRDESDDRKHKSHRRSPDRRDSRRERGDNDDHHHYKKSKWEDSPPQRRGRGGYEGSSKSYDYDREREKNRERKGRQKHRYDDDGKSYEWGRKDKGGEGDEKDKEKPKEKPNFGLSGKLAEDTNKVNGFVIKYAEPEEARVPKRRWRLYPFKGEKSLPTLYIHRQSCYLIGRERKLVDLPVDHPSCSKQHAVLQYRLMPYEKPNGGQGKRVLPYIIDLDSANGTFLNNKQIEPRRYYQLMEKDVLKFGFSTREYVLLHETSKDDNDETDEEPVAVKEEKTE